MLLDDRFGVFYERRWAIEFAEVHGHPVGKRKLLDRASPLRPLVLDPVAINAPANAAAGGLVILPIGSGEAWRVGTDGDIAIIRHPAVSV